MKIKKLNNITHFGFKKIKKEEKINMVNEVFNSVVDNYDLMNDLLSFGIHRWWKYFAINVSEIKYGQYILDLAGGTGDLTIQASPLVGKKGHVVLMDYNKLMLKKAKEKIRNQGIINVSYVQADAEYIPFLDNSFDCVIVSFGLRNFTNKKKVLSSIFRVLKYGGKLIVLEFSKPNCKFLNKLYDIYSFYFMPLIGFFIAKDEKSYSYLAESIRVYPNQKKFKKMMLNVGFKNVNYYNLTGGIVALHRGFKF